MVEKPSDLEDLERRLKKHRNLRKAKKRQRTRNLASPYNFGFRLVADLVGAIIAGFLAGWGLDSWLGTSPWMVLIFTPLGMVAGIVSVVRAASSDEAERHLAAVAAAMPEIEDDGKDQKGEEG